MIINLKSVIVTVTMLALLSIPAMVYADDNTIDEANSIVIQMSNNNSGVDEAQAGVISPNAYIYKDWFYWYYNTNLNFDFPSQYYVSNVPTGLYDSQGKPIYYKGWLDYQYEIVHPEGGYINGVWVSQYKQAYYEGTISARIN